MTRISLKEAYDNKDVIAQIYAIRDTAESAVDTSEQAVTTANTASEHVDALVPQVEQAVENANQASASAETSAQTVAGYENRLGAAEGDIVQLNTDVEGVESDLNAVTLRVQTAEGNIVTIQGRVTALETADGQNVKLTGANAIGNYAVLLTGNQATIAGFKGFSSSVSLPPALRTGNGVHTKILSFTGPNASTNYIFDICVSNKRSLTAGRFIVTTASDKTIASVSWVSGYSTGTPRCEIGAYTESNVLYLTVAGTEGGSYNAVNILGAIAGDGYPLNSTFANRETVTVGVDYQGVVIS